MPVNATYPVVNYGQLKLSVQDYMNNNNARLINAIPSFINSAMRNTFDDPDFRINPFRDTIELTVSNDGIVYKPSDYLEAKHLWIKTSGVSPRVLTRVPWDSIQNNEYLTGGFPEFFSDNGNSFIITPAPEAGFKVQVDYYFYPATLGSTANVTAANYTLSAAGTGYVVGDELTSDIPTEGEAATFTVTTVNNGVITQLSGQTAGSNFAKGTTYSLTGGTGSGASIQIPSVDNEANWLIINEPNLLIYGACYEASLYLDDMEKADKWKMRYDDEGAKIVARQKSDEFSGGILVMQNGLAGLPAFSRSVSDFYR